MSASEDYGWLVIGVSPFKDCRDAQDKIHTKYGIYLTLGQIGQGLLCQRKYWIEDQDFYGGVIPKVKPGSAKIGEEERFRFIPKGGSQPYDQHSHRHDVSCGNKANLLNIITRASTGASQMKAFAEKAPTPTAQLAFLKLAAAMDLTATVGEEAEKEARKCGMWGT